MKKKLLPFAVQSLFAYVSVGNPVLGYQLVYTMVGTQNIPIPLVQHARPSNHGSVHKKKLIVTGKGRDYNSRSSHRQHNSTHYLGKQTIGKQRRQQSRQRAVQNTGR